MENGFERDDDGEDAEGPRVAFGGAFLGEGKDVDFGFGFAVVARVVVAFALFVARFIAAMAADAAADVPR